MITAGLFRAMRMGNTIQGKTEVGSALSGYMLSWGISLSKAFTYRDGPKKPIPCWVFCLQRSSPEIIPGDAFTLRRQMSSWYVFLTRLKGMFYSPTLPCRINTSEQSSYWSDLHKILKDELSCVHGYGLLPHPWASSKAMLHNQGVGVAEYLEGLSFHSPEL